MTPERMAGLVGRWVRLYTRELPPPVARRRAGEIDADLHDHIAHERTHGTGERRIVLGIAARMVRGMAADVSWRGHVGARSSTPKEVKMNRSLVRVALVTACILAVPLVGMQFGDGVDWGVFDFVFAGAFLMGSGLLLELAVRHPGSLGYRVAAAAIGIAAIVLGESDDAPGFVLFGCLLIAGTIALTVRAVLRSG